MSEGAKSALVILGIIIWVIIGMIWPIVPWIAIAACAICWAFGGE